MGGHRGGRRGGCEDCAAGKEKYECSPLCADKRPSAGGRGPGHAARAAAAAPGRGSPAAPGSQGRRRPQHSGGAGGRCPRTTRARPERAWLRPSGAQRGPRGARGRRSPPQVSPAGGGARAAPPRCPGPAFRRAGPASPFPGLGSPSARGPTPQPGPPGAPLLRRPTWAWAGGAGWPYSGSRRSGPDAGCLALSGAQGSTGDLPGPPVAGVTLPRNHSGQRPYQGPSQVLEVRGPAAHPRDPVPAPSAPLERARCARAHSPAGPAEVRPEPGARASDAELRASGSPEGDGTLGHGGGTGMSAPARPRRGPSKAGDGGPPRCPWPGPGHERIFILG